MAFDKDIGVAQLLIQLSEQYVSQSPVSEESKKLAERSRLVDRLTDASRLGVIARQRQALENKSEIIAEAIRLVNQRARPYSSKRNLSIDVMHCLDNKHSLELIRKVIADLKIVGINHVSR